MANLAEIYLSRPRIEDGDRMIVTGIYQGANTLDAPVLGAIITDWDTLGVFSAHGTTFGVPTAVKVDLNPHFRVGVARAVVTWEGWRVWAT